MTNQNQRVRRVGLAAGGGGGGGAGMLGRSPSVVSDSSKRSVKSSGYGQQSKQAVPQYNRLYSPNGSVRNKNLNGEPNGLV